MSPQTGCCSALQVHRRQLHPVPQLLFEANSNNISQAERKGFIVLTFNWRNSLRALLDWTEPGLEQWQQVYPVVLARAYLPVPLTLPQSPKVSLIVPPAVADRFLLAGDAPSLFLSDPAGKVEKWLSCSCGRTGNEGTVKRDDEWFIRRNRSWHSDLTGVGWSCGAFDVSFLLSPSRVWDKKSEQTATVHYRCHFTACLGLFFPEKVKYPSLAVTQLRQAMDLQ